MTLLSRLKGGHPLAAIATLALGTAIGVVFTLTATRYQPHWVSTLSGNDSASGQPSESTGFASRLSYELSRVPEGPPPRSPEQAAEPQVSPPAGPVVAPAPPQQPATEPLPAERVPGARPISSVPPEARDRTQEIQKERQKPEYRETPRQSAAPAPKLVEGRDVPLKPREPPASALRTTEPPAKSPPPAAPEVAAPSAAPAERDSVDARFRATREWLAAAPQTTHTIQLMGTPSEAQLQHHLQALSKVLETDKLYVYRTLAQGKPSITVLYGAYPDRQSALQALQDLPAAAAAYRPVVRTVNGIRTELKQNAGKQTREEGDESSK